MDMIDKVISVISSYVREVKSINEVLNELKLMINNVDEILKLRICDMSLKNNIINH